VAGGFGGQGLPGGLEREGVRWVPLDITSDESVRAAVRESRPERVYHLAGQASVGESFRSPESTWEVNATGTLRLLEALRASGGAARLLLTSSAEVYGSVAEADQPIQEDAPLRPLTPYGASKAAAEMVALQYALSGTLEVMIARSFNQIGPGQDQRFVLPSFAWQLVRIRRGEEEPALSVGNLEVSRDFLDIRDGVRGYVTIMERGVSGTAYNVCSGTAVSLETVVRKLIELSGTNSSLEVDPERVRPVDIPVLEGDSSRLRALGWSAEISLGQSLADLLEEVGARLSSDG
jgi:GDP-4-dehydro-6-deoxy-D-mannose reductase